LKGLTVTSAPACSLTHPGTIAAARVVCEDLAIAVVSVYGRMYGAGRRHDIRVDDDAPCRE